MSHSVPVNNPRILRKLSSITIDVPPGDDGSNKEDGKDEKVDPRSLSPMIRRRALRLWRSSTARKEFLQVLPGSLYEPGCHVAPLVLRVPLFQNGLNEGWSEDDGIVSGVYLLVIVLAIINYKQSRQFRKLWNVSSDKMIEVVSGGRKQKISIVEVLVDDLVCLKIGDRIPADRLFVDGHSLKVVDELSVTRENGHVEVNGNENPFLLSGTKVTEGYFIGKTPDESGSVEYRSGQTKRNDVTRAILMIIAPAGAMVVVAIPMGLPQAVTLTLAYAKKRMVSDNIAMVRKLSACETTGSATTICTDKIGALTLKYPCHLEVRSAVESCKNEGVNFKMITGDDVHTARAIAIECGILETPKDNSKIEEMIVEGVEFRNFSPGESFAAVDRIRVTARSFPFDKLLMVQTLKHKGDVVAVTGDRTNDAPAFKEADIGLSMGIQGTEVAKESSDIVILDGNFVSVVTILRWGRCMYNNIQLTVIVAAHVINVVAALSSAEVPLNAVQLLWVHLIVDILGALALTTERPTNDLLSHPPMQRSEPHITLVFIEFNARKLKEKNGFKGFHKNKLFIGIIGVTLVFQVLMIEFLKKLANAERLGWTQWAACIGIASLTWPIGWLVKCIPLSSVRSVLPSKQASAS
ncbi:hypothetical protein CRG98_034734 [Punica granatum]|uniref:Cation-transporting P-type ATPase C-terminal domain-containing protein n=1 Tax=Punica granatum TaxID=22663 RepID=A0A2I0IN43_PUNGR|nr:hypothetical protein CRG98_034734 [Punica granatum]